jgi:hypothetical protein
MRGGFATLLALALPALAAAPAFSAEDARECSGAAPIDLARLLTAKDGGIRHRWGEPNVAALPKEAGTDGSVLRVRYPAGSFSPGRSPVVGGAGFELARPSAAKLCLSYKVRFPEGFDFAKGGKLPGLFGGAAPRGCVAAGAADGFSARLMWRASGAGELYLYAPDRGARCGESIGRGSWTFGRGAWTAVMQRIAFGKGRSGGDLIEVRIDGRPVVRLEAALSPSSARAGLLFSTFFGGDDASWATRAEQHADFADFRLLASPN